MYEIIKNVIEARDYKLEDMLYKIAKMYIESRITEKQKDELDNLARTNAKAENNYDIQKQFDEIFARLDKLENKDTENVEQEEYPEFKEPTGSHDSYRTGDKILFNDKKYICKLDNCVWSPETYPSAWELIEEKTEESDNTENKVEGEE